MKKIFLHKTNKKIKVFLNDVQNTLTVLGPLGTLTYVLPTSKTKKFSNKAFFIYKNDLNLLTNKIYSLFKSVTKGWFVELNLNGVGYKCFKEKDQLLLDIGYSNLISFKILDKVKIKIFRNKIILFSIDKEFLQNIAFLFKSYALPDVYKGKGILFKNEVVKLKKKK